MFEQLLGAIEPFMRDYGALALFVVLTLESLGLPLPGESALITAGTLAGRGELSVWAMLASAWAGAVLGDNIGYLVGRWAGRPVVLDYGSRIGITPARFAKVEAAFERYGHWTVIFARFVNVLRQLNGVVAGTMGMDWRVFVLCNALGGALWVLTWGVGAWWLASHLGYLHLLEDWARQAEAAVLPALAIAVAGWFAWRWRRRRAAGARPPASTGSP